MAILAVDGAGQTFGAPDEAGDFSEVPDAPLAANARLAIGFPPRSAVNGRARAVGPAITNVFGNGTTGAAGALAIRMRHVPGWTAQAPNESVGHSTPAPVFGAGDTIDNRCFALRFFNSGISAANNPNFPLRYGWHAKDNGNNQMGAEVISGAAINLMCPVLDVTDQGVIDAVLILRRTAAGEFQALAIQPGDSAVRVGQVRTPGTWLGISSTGAVMSMGCVTAGSSANFANYFGGGDLSNFVQLDGTHGTDAEWLRFANGENPATIWPSNLAAHYRMGGPDDLARTAGSRGYATLVEGGTGLYKSSALLPTPGTVTAANSLFARGTTWGATHALSPTAMIENRDAGGGAAGLLAKTGRVFLPVVVGGAATHLEVRVVRDDGAGTVIQDWTRWTSAAATGAVTLERDGIRPSGGLGHRYDVRREDDTACVSMCRNREDVGLVIANGPSQSQMEIGNTGGAATGTGVVPLTAAAGQFVTFSNSRWRGITLGRWIPSATGFFVNPGMGSDGMHAYANYWAEQFPGVRLNIVALAIEGSGTQLWLQNSQYRTNTGFGYWGDGSDVTTGFVTATMKAHRNRITAFNSSWHTDDTVAVSTWFARINEMYGNVGASDAQAVIPPFSIPFASRSNFVKAGLPWRAYVLMYPVSRSAGGAMTAGALTTQATFRANQAEWVTPGANRAPLIDAFLAAHQPDIQMGGVVDPHQTQGAARGNPRWGLSLGRGVARAAGLWNVALPAVSGAVRTSATVITVSFALPAGWTLRTADAVTPTEFHVSEDGGANWVVAKTIATAAIAGGVVTLTRNSGSWAAAGSLRVMYNRGAPISNNNLATDNAELGGMLYGEVAAGDAVKALWTGANASLVNGLVVSPNVAAVPVSIPSSSLVAARAVHASGSPAAMVGWQGQLLTEAGAHGSPGSVAAVTWVGPVSVVAASHASDAGAVQLSAGGEVEPMHGLHGVSDRISFVSIDPGFGPASVPMERVLVVRPEGRILRAD